MAISKTNAGWLVDSQPGGRGAKRYRKTLKTKAEALAYEAWLTTNVSQNPEWQPTKKDSRKLLDLVEIWYTNHGINLRSSKDTYARLKAMCISMKNPIAAKFTSDIFAEYRAKRMENGITANNLNREHAYLKAVFNELTRLGHWKSENPLAKVRQIKIVEKELTFLTNNQIKTLLSKLTSEALLITKICLSTGARWSEAEGLRVSQVRNGQLHFAETKSGKNRSVPIDETLIEELNSYLEKRYGSSKAIAEHYFQYGYGAFRTGLEDSGLILPKGQLTHVLRHTFASHFMMNGGNILTLQKILGHSSLTMTMRYAHLAPEHLQEAKKLNPLAKLEKTEFPL